MPLRNETLYEPVPALTLDLTPPTPPEQIGVVYWDAVDNTLAVRLMIGDYPVTLQIGQETVAYVWNNTGIDIANGAAGYANGALSYRPTVALSQANSILTSLVHGLATMPIIKNTQGFATLRGLVRGYDTHTPGWSEGDLLYLSDTVAGGLQNTPPTAGFNVVVGRVLRVHPTEGMVFIEPRPIPAFGDLVGGNYTQFDYAGIMRAIGAARTYVDENFSPLSALGASAPDLINLDGTSIQIAAFDGNATLEQVSAHVEMQHDYAEGTDVVLHVHWMPTDANAGNVEWFCEYYIRSGNTVLATGTASAVQAAPGVAWREQRLDIATLTGTSFVIGMQVSLRLYRNPGGANDTYGSDAAVSTFGYHYLVDGLGSRLISSK